MRFARRLRLGILLFIKVLPRTNNFSTFLQGVNTPVLSFRLLDEKRQDKFNSVALSTIGGVLLRGTIFKAPPTKTRTEPLSVQAGAALTLYIWAPEV